MSEQTLSYKVEGLAELEANLRAMGTDVAVKWTNGGLRAGARTLQLAAQGNVPVKSGELKKTIRIRRGKKDRADNVREYFVFAGSRKAGGGGAFYAHMVEGGTRPHVVSGHTRDGDKAGRVLFGGNYARGVNHPGAKPVHYMERAARAGVATAVEAFGRYIRTKLDKARLDAATETE